tara:strand:+ start:917 stop:3364 length:2448 start_codon:yes stop_codon:yes gene_type:complete
MAISNPKLFGLNVLSFLADVENKNLALKSLDLNVFDLDIIRGSANAGAQRRDWVSFSRLKQPIHKAITRFESESGQFSRILGDRAGTDNILFGNLTINGALSGNAIRYRYIKGLGTNSRTIGIADISTSRVSSWSSSASPVIATSPISYGARVGIKAGSALQFGSAPAGQKRLKTSITPTAKEFDSEFPTSEITTIINGSPVKLYAMKGIPLIFRGFFRNLDASITLSGLLNGTPASWKVVETGNANNYVNFANKDGQTTSISFRSSRSRERNVQFYYNPDFIRQITIQSSGIDTLPVTKLTGLTYLNLRYNNLKNFPDFISIAPNLKSLLLSHNPFYLSETASERKLTSTIIDKIPAALTSLHLPGTFYGSIDPNLFSKFTNITDFQLGRGGGAYFHPDGVHANTPLPNISNTCATYTAYSNDFRSIAATSGNNKNIKDLTNLSYLHISGNYYLVDSQFSIASSVINYINLASTGLPIPNLAGKTQLQTAYCHYMRSNGGLFSGNTYKFNNCNALETLYLYATNIGGRFPRFTNASLSYLEMRYTNVTGGFKDGTTTDDSHAISDQTFRDCPSLRTFYVMSGNLLTQPIATSTFTFTPALQNLLYRSYGRTTGAIPNLNVCSDLRYLNLYYNAFSSGTPNLQSSLNINYVNLSYNKLSGQIPAFRNLSNLSQLYLHNNKYTGLSEFSNLPNLRYFYCHNQFTDGAPGISGQIPDFSSCPRMYYLIMYNNSFTSYKTGAFESLYQLKYLDISNNELSSQALEQIIEDLYSNYTTTPRGGVTVNLKNAMISGATLPDPTLDKIVLLRAKSWTVILQ